MTTVLIRDTEERRGPYEDRQRLESCSHKPRNIWSHEKLEKAWKDSLLELWTERGPSDTLISDLWPPEP